MHPHGMKPARTRWAFLLCYAAYTAIYLARLNLSMASPVLKSDGTLTAAQIGLLGGIFSAVYAVGRLMNGARCDHVPLVGLAGRLLYPAAARGLRSDSRTASAGFALCAAATLPLALHIPSPWASVICLSLLYAAVSLVNTYVLSVFPMSFAADGCAASVSGLLDFATYLGAGLSAAVYGVVIEHVGYAPMFASWAVLAILSLIWMRKVK